MSVERLTIEEFLCMPRDEQNVRYCELSDHDKFRARMEDWSLETHATPEEIEDFFEHPPEGMEWVKEARAEHRRRAAEFRRRVAEEMKNKGR